ncbi:MAG: hypothetical protein K0S01_3413 [Herbinix sp.]|jgi:hypothetical protein|nr:hypothetical protein [Herbinix sp.]
MKHCFIYLDWNVIKDLKDNGKETEFYKIITTLKSKYIVPYSFAHLCDLQKKLKAETIPLIQGDLNFFNEYSNGYMLGRDEDDYDISQQNIFSMYQEVAKYNLNLSPKFEIPEQIIEDFLVSGAENFLKVKENVVYFIPLFYMAMDRFNCNPKLYNAFREVFKTTPETKELQFLFNLQKKDISYTELRELVDKYLNISSKHSNLLCDKLRNAYMLLDFNPVYREKVNNKTNFTNMYTDCEHMLNASHATYYITKDRDTHSRTKFVYEAYGIKTQVFNKEELIDYVLNGCKAD